MILFGNLWEPMIEGLYPCTTKYFLSSRLDMLDLVASLTREAKQKKYISRLMEEILHHPMTAQVPGKLTKLTPHPLFNVEQPPGWCRIPVSDHLYFLVTCRIQY